jgi:UDP-3-O-[3-hydroxymyristoyl] glucosamine N-acyltransferase
LKSIDKKTFKNIKNYLKDNNIDLKSELSDDELFDNFKSISKSTENDLTFFNKNISNIFIINTKAKACIINEDNKYLLPKSTKPIVVNDVYKVFSYLTNFFTEEIVSTGIISSLSSINRDVKLGNNIQIDPFVTIKENCIIDNNVIIGSNCTIGPNVFISQDTHIHSNSSLMECEIGKKCVVKSGAIIGGTGFGFDSKSKIKIQHTGKVIIKNNCNIGSNTTIDRAVFEETFIDENCFLDNLVQIAHNVSLGRDTIIAAQSGIAGSTKIGKNVTIGGQVGIAGHLSIGNNVVIAAKSGVTKNIEDNLTIAGFPAINIKKWKIMNIKLNKLK